MRAKDYKGRRLASGESAEGGSRKQSDDDRKALYSPPEVLLSRRKCVTHLRKAQQYCNCGIPKQIQESYETDFFSSASDSMRMEQSTLLCASSIRLQPLTMAVPVRFHHFLKPTGSFPSRLF